jgi:4,5-DOPA dioxygenase extradiol
MDHKNNSDAGAQIVYFSHGGGPLPILGDPGHKAMIDFMTALPERLHKPEVILVISAHWEERAPTLLGSDYPPMFYDYYGFPAESYEINYPAPGSPALVDMVTGALQKNGFPCAVDPGRGYDHGHFIPLKLMYPQADIPTTQLSLIRGLDAETHVRLGKALGVLRSENILVIGSGFSFHNMSAFSWQSLDAPDPANDAFQNWLIETCTGSLPETEREMRLVKWEKAPSARYCHPREEHLLPLHVCQGMASKPAELIFDDKILGKRSLGFCW